MINKEDGRHEENNHACLEEAIHWITRINDTRLYWLWIKFVIMAGSLTEWVGFSNAISVLNTMEPVVDVLSWSIPGGRCVLQSISEIQRRSQIAEETSIGVTKVACLSDLLWSASNLLSAQWLRGNELRPSVGTLGWSGNLCMEVLLVYDVICVVWLFRYEQHQVNDVSMLSNAQQIQWQNRKQTLLINLIYTSILACGFLLFRGFSAQINNTIPPYIGAGLCAVSTGLFRGIEWGTILSKLQKKQRLAMPNTAEHQHLQYAFQQTCVGAGVSVGLDLFLPLFLWLSSDTSNMSLVIALSLSINTLISGCFKRDKAIQLSCCWFFSNKSASVLPMFSEIPQPSGVV